MLALQTCYFGSLLLVQQMQQAAQVASLQLNYTPKTQSNFTTILKVAALSDYWDLKKEHIQLTVVAPEATFANSHPASKLENDVHAQHILKPSLDTH